MKKDLALAIQREKELNSICKDQAAQIEHLNKKVLDFSTDAKHLTCLAKNTS